MKIFGEDEDCRGCLGLERQLDRVIGELSDAKQTIEELKLEAQNRIPLRKFPN